MSAEAGFIGKLGALARKDMRLESRARDTLPPMLAFAFAVLIVLAFTIPEPSEMERVARTDVLAGFLWITVLFAGLIGFARTFEVEREEGALDVLLLVPVDRSGLFLAKAAANFVFVVVTQIFLVPAFVVMFALDAGNAWWALVVVVLLADVGFALVGTLFASIAAQTRSRELVLPILCLPALVPVFIAATELTSDLLVGSGVDIVIQRGWFGILVAFDLLLAIVGSLLFEFAID